MRDCRAHLRLVSRGALLRLVSVYKRVLERIGDGLVDCAGLPETIELAELRKVERELRDELTVLEMALRAIEDTDARPGPDAALLRDAGPAAWATALLLSTGEPVPSADAPPDVQLGVRLWERGYRLPPVWLLEWWAGKQHEGERR